VLELTRGLNETALDAIADLERRVVAADGGRLKLEWGDLRSRTGQHVEDLLWWGENGRLLGFLGLYSFSAPTVELSGMVDPDSRRRGIATELLKAALPLCQERAYTKALLVTPRTPTAGRDLALRLGGTLDHCEYALQLTGTPAAAPINPRVTVRQMTSADEATVRSLLAMGFGWEGPESDQPDAEHDHAGTLIISLDDDVVGSLRLTREDDTAGVYGFVIHPDHRGRGIGRDVLRRVCVQALTDGAARVHLEVAVDNDRALGLYTSLGFAPISTEDYYTLPF
jgi:ribosomal protein S18 acetylase RimI-like enzyme